MGPVAAGEPEPSEDPVPEPAAEPAEPDQVVEQPGAAGPAPIVGSEPATEPDEASGPDQAAQAVAAEPEPNTEPELTTEPELADGASNADETRDADEPRSPAAPVVIPARKTPGKKGLSRKTLGKKSAGKTVPVKKAPDRSGTPERKGALAVPLIIMLLIAGFVGGLSYWRLATPPKRADIIPASATGPAGTSGNSGSSGEEQGLAIVVVRDSKFSPSNITIKAGETVTWRFDDNGIKHSVAGLTDFAMMINSPYMGTGDYTVKFTQPGVYRYICGVHPTMRGTVTVR